MNRADTIDELEEMISYRKSVTGLDHTIFISPRGMARHAPRIKVAIDPPDSLDPRGHVAVVTISTQTLVEGQLPAKLGKPLRAFLKLNQAVLLDYWDYRIDTDQLRQRLRPV
jgi:hypothetical protein